VYTALSLDDVLPADTATTPRVLHDERVADRDSFKPLV
jgi:hypothetical protein